MDYYSSYKITLYTDEMVKTYYLDPSSAITKQAWDDLTDDKKVEYLSKAAQSKFLKTIKTKVKEINLWNSVN